ncbi:hypothetical protein LSAT2_008447 [Lamellibrachia satsuma]|nr:hypothetical protein LSAT2_008447 [Lamellibrachia satsuma]
MTSSVRYATPRSNVSIAGGAQSPQPSYEPAASYNMSAHSVDGNAKRKTVSDGGWTVRWCLDRTMVAGPYDGVWTVPTVDLRIR